MKNISKQYIALFVLAFSLVAGVALPTFASDNNIGFAFTIQSYQEESTTGWRYRQTKSTANPWKVGVYTSTEGNGSYYSAHLYGSQNGALASPTKNAYTGPAYPYVYSGAYSNASQQNVRMAVFNPTWTPSVFYITGAWDEETW
ncbi:MAG: DUF2712 domain-containing protein [Oenococcus sp.]|uniref:DUF2712 domain-containing protein n=2 Tax=Oenococcus kitaharae TaxID=336988 RepID=G9WIX7_9LACO|nr:DUF2712 domain-containing protein [Oenococcus kitaharae]EHN58426.1 hypothetical protein OKIT_0302 [Oenococcus kitaharae DSM 17330]MCV3296335.1 DUF2712 domain-containing protein [Oenococcus kitaharae]OEY81668.1 hypothetical protein NT95_07835 [Oenococcus kitaharae]OEY83154.1 hypothetical protein NV75_05935 [Oenococcus kitaharae]OEY84676.1 hypothetical protein NT96_04700 [Oenococcus kitaharae]